MPWNPERYHQFQRERSAPFEDALALVNRRENLSVIDLGCGTGELTRRLADALPGSEVLGIDSSPEMLERARPLERSGLRFEQRAIQKVEGAWDVVFSHAVIHWIDDHPALIPWLFSLVRPGGQLVVQLPDNHSHPTHQFMLETGREEPFVSALNGWQRDFPTLPVEEYAELLYNAGGINLTVFEKVYPHILQDADALADWTSGTALVPYFERLDEEMRERFMARYRARLRARYPGSPVFYGFRRILFAATRPA
jgi:trans-aconitate 2-methyltransferase